MADQSPHYPSQAPIEAYGDGGFRFAGMSHRGSIVCLPTGIYGWRPTALADVTVADLDVVIRNALPMSLLLIGTGEALTTLPEHLRTPLRDAQLRPEVMDTGAACRTYNVLLAEHRPIAALLLKVE